jgi:hypothetical protein
MRIRTRSLAHRIGAASAGAVGAAIGSVVPGIGTVVGAGVGAVVGAVAGGLAGKAVGEMVNPSAEDAYWKSNYASRPYVQPGSTYDEYQPAYKYGWESRTQHAGKKFEDVETDLSRGWDRVKGKSRLEWDRAKSATREAWDHVENKVSNATDRPANPNSAGATGTTARRDY